LLNQLVTSFSGREEPMFYNTPLSQGDNIERSHLHLEKSKVGEVFSFSAKRIDLVATCKERTMSHPAFKRIGKKE
jgi:hypothetical protein